MCRVLTDTLLWQTLLGSDSHSCCSSFHWQQEPNTESSRVPGDEASTSNITTSVTIHCHLQESAQYAKEFFCFWVSKESWTRRRHLFFLLGALQSNSCSCCNHLHTMREVGWAVKLTPSPLISSHYFLWDKQQFLLPAPKLFWRTWDSRRHLCEKVQYDSNVAVETKFHISSYTFPSKYPSQWLLYITINLCGIWLVYFLLPISVQVLEGQRREKAFGWS